jgi:tRNA pseudouridine55 synthase
MKQKNIRYEMIEINGWLNIYKPYKYKSTTIVAIIKQMLKPLGVKKVGHGGTLDPLAEGVLPICINKATKTTIYTMAYKKIYNFQIKFREETITDDVEGRIINTSDKIPTLDEINAILPKFTGKIQQTPPNSWDFHKR